MSSPGPYHHGRLREELLDRAAVVLRDRGATALSLRELARDIGVSHAAPHRHFAHRQALLDALAAEGFARLARRLEDAVAAAPDFRGQVRSLAGAYVDFATTDANLLELLFAHKQGGCDESIGQNAARAFAPTREVFQRGQSEGQLPSGDPSRMGLIFLATLHGLAAMTNGGLIQPEQLDEMIDDAVAQVLHAERSAPA